MALPSESQGRRSMQLALFKTLWGFSGSMAEAIADALEAGFQGIEGQAPAAAFEAREFRRALDESSLHYIAEITTAGSYVPDRIATLEQHLDSLRTGLERSAECSPLFVTCLGGCDAWEEDQSVEFFGRAMALASAAGLPISFETHRGRSFFNPWTTLRIVRQLPDIQLTCDFSHWCVVCERLLDSEINVIELLATRAHHIHARVGYDQGPQVPHPGAPEYAPALRAHQAWWEIIWRSQCERSYTVTTMTPEFGPDGYLHEAPFSREPVADLWDLNRWMAEEETRHFERFSAPK
jgi:sugar phosphate isomerase/epimerase